MEINEKEIFFNNCNENDLNELNYSKSSNDSGKKSIEIKKSEELNHIKTNNEPQTLPNIENKISKLSIESIINFDDFIFTLICFICRKLHLMYKIIGCRKCENYVCESCSGIDSETLENLMSQSKLEKFGIQPTCFNANCKRFKPKRIDKIARKILSMIKISCENKDCQVQLNYENYLDHLDICEYRKKICNNCNESILFKFYDHHLNDICDYGNISCNSCYGVFLRKDLNQHILDCDHQTLKCAGCKKNYLKKDFKIHLDECNFIYVNCEKCNEQYNTKQTHNCMNVLIKDRDELLKVIENISNSIDERDIEIRNINSKYNEIKLSKIDLEYQIQKYKNENLELKQKICFLKNDVAKETIYNKINHLEQEINRYKDENFNLRIFIENNNLTISDLKKQISLLNDHNKFQTNFTIKSCVNVANICNTCYSNELTINNSVKCKQCKELVCIYCKENCFICFQNFCSQHMNYCQKCSNSVCRGDLSICEGCEGAKCSKCFDIDNICDACTWKFDNLNKDKLIVIEESKLVARTYNTSNCVSSLVIGDKIFSAANSGIYKWELKIKSSICKFTDFGLFVLDSNKFKFDKELKFSKNKISTKYIAPLILNKLYYNSFIFTVNFKLEIFEVEIDGIVYSEKLVGKFFIPFFYICNNCLLLKQIFTLSNY